MREYKQDVYFEALIESQLAHKENLATELERAEALTNKILSLINFTPQEHKVFELRMLKTSTYKDISKRLNVPLRKVKWLIQKVKKKINAFNDFILRTR